MPKKTKTSGSPAAIQVALKKATTEMMVLKLLRERPMYTYEMMSTIEERSGGDIVFSPSTAWRRTAISRSMKR